MGRFTAMFNELAKSFSPTKRGKSCGQKEVAEVMAKEAKKDNMILRSSGSININTFASICSKRGEKGVNQDCCIVWEEFGCQKDMMFCGIFDGHGPWGHYVAKRVCESMPSSLLCNWQEMLFEASLDPHTCDKKLDIWKDSFIKTCAVVDRDIRHCHKFDSIQSGTTALAAIRQGELVVIANVGDSRAILATIVNDGCLVAVQLTVDFKPNLPDEAERIVECKGRVLCLEDEPGVHRLWLPNEESPGLAMSRAFGDYCVKDYGLISVPQVTHRHIISKDQFIVLASDGVWDVVSNEQAVEIVSSTDDRAKSAKRLVEFAARAWKRKRKGIAVDDISAICLFFH
ncbi:probable protein phosphatase 2C 73 [Cynara cardunculus var. scolymus]|uniref:protein-serine/threonine phosphatase n=1 Tax=Cynara cardunculus var. scolymus TaxID=59895 RepID=A0A103Y9C3_CYNCS|nr:probable protein phosphatase 2C 73 [Cynara cardunculus var. scolymus]KVI04916.1 Protein phosphatase 2C [Cynara cardunculus var. scolymus]